MSVGKHDLTRSDVSVGGMRTFVDDRQYAGSSMHEMLDPIEQQINERKTKNIKARLILAQSRHAMKAFTIALLEDDGRVEDP